MPHTALTAQDFRQHPALETEPRHWLIDSSYGRQMLKAKLRVMRPGLYASQLLWQRRLDPLLNTALDLLDLREWPKPRTIGERIRAFWIQFQMLVRILEGRPLPTWKTHAPARLNSPERQSHMTCPLPAYHLN